MPDMQDRIDGLTRHRDKLQAENQELLDEIEALKADKAALLRTVAELRGEGGSPGEPVLTPVLKLPPHGAK